MRTRVFWIAGLVFFALMAPAPATVRAGAQLAVAVMPPVERQWTERDYETALMLLRQTAPGDLPRANSPVLQRLIDPQNLDILNDNAIPLQSRLRLGARLVQSTTEILRLYLAALQTDPLRNDDILWVEGFMLQEASILVRLADQSVAGLDPSGADYDERMGGLEQMKAGLLEVVSGCIMALDAKEAAASDARRHLAEVVRTEWPRIASLLPDPTRRGIESAMKALSEHEADPGVKAAIVGL